MQICNNKAGMKSKDKLKKQTKTKQLMTAKHELEKGTPIYMLNSTGKALHKGFQATEGCLEEGEIVIPMDEHISW